MSIQFFIVSNAFDLVRAPEHRQNGGTVHKSLMRVNASGSTFLPLGIDDKCNLRAKSALQCRLNSLEGRPLVLPHVTQYINCFHIRQQQCAA